METEMEAKLINRFSIEAAGNGKGLLGDINGDGRMEVVFVRADGDIDDRYVPHQVTCVTAFDLEGNMLTGDMPVKQQKYIAVWADIHADELSENWDIAQNDEQPKKIEPLR